MESRKTAAMSFQTAGAETAKECLWSESPWRREADARRPQWCSSLARDSSVDSPERDGADFEISYYVVCANCSV